ncbi:hypothetical protein TNIN_231921 [Trichonephila inaurata madagascariensis]|uniref:C2H2-type domain-containing protein n=1 Tax=Trichonephila inaurata madagascariensis TaxID=2747483 RepID=A0A8X6XQJ8_9ARAC|nr:hypothetical protein TNIN_231921 [Trichonephila inaurata madagascariensis]
MSAELSGGDTDYVCDTCHRTFHFRRHYLKHMQVHKETFSHQCFQCAAAFNSSLEFLDHFKNHVQDLDLNYMYCRESFSSRDTLRRHQNNRTRKNPFICEMDHTKFNTERSQHVMLHGAERSVNSGVCNLVFPQKEAKETFMHHTMGRNNSIVLFVEKSFVTNLSLKNIKRHTAM